MQTDWKALFSENIRNYEGYSIGKLFALLSDPEIISLAGGLPSPEMFPKDEMRRVSSEALESRIDEIMQYSPIPGEPRLIEAVIRYLEKDGIRVAENQVLVTSSGQQGLDLTGRLLLDPGDPVLVDRPTFAGALVAFRMQRPRFAGVELEADGSRLEDVRRQIRDFAGQSRKPKFIYVVPDFQNPTGITMSVEKRRALLQISEQSGIPIVEDSPYRSLRYRGAQCPSLFSLDQQLGGDHVIGVYTFSKLFCPGMRVGFNIGPAAVVEKMRDIKEGGTLNTPKYNQDMCAAFLLDMDWEAHLEKCRGYYRRKLQVLLESLEKNFPADWQVRWTRPEGGLFVWLSLPERVDTLQLFHQAVQAKVAFVPGEVFYGENPERHHLRLNFSFPPEERLKEAVSRLAECVGRAIRH